MALPWHLLLLVASVIAVRCPDGNTCSEKTLCCELPGGNGYGCCPEKEVVSHSLPMITSVSCTDQTGCPEEYSCVSTPQGGSACCPVAQGTSCQDGHHCCPSGSHCSEDGHHCIPASNMSAVICPDGRSECPSDTSCCQMADQSWGCCPMPQATCCSDHLHCCPHNTLCDLEHNKCTSENGDVPLSRKVPARVKLVPFEQIVRRTPCQDGSSCPDGSTCCEQLDGSYGCCPFMSAVCCDDHVHCCPSGTTCDLSQKKCVGQNLRTPLFRKTKALREQATVKCDDTSACPDESTCCRLASGDWGCCPFEKAVCCSDKIHCCPNGYTCNGGSCQMEGLSIPWYEKIPAFKQNGGDVKCDDTASCPDKTTCCQLLSGQWGCCPIEQAVCCSDKIHCCPNGYTCNGGSCQMEGRSIPWYEKIPAFKPNGGDVKCDDTASCPDKTTCCQLLSGQWGCCPIEQALCCSDHLHCCPSGYTCDVASGTCNKPLKESSPLATTQPSLGVVWCDAYHYCSDGTTCCVGPGGVWSCCPYAQGVCCPDRMHCCPYGHVCLNYGAQCSRSGNLRWDLRHGENTLL